jgi:tetrapyrrole methylase family protein/MazG family protein
MAVVTVIGLGPGPISGLTSEAKCELLGSDKIFFRTAAHPVHEWLHGLGKHLICFDHLYSLRWDNPGAIYEFIASALLKEATLRGHAVYALPGSPVVLEDTTRLLRLRGEDAGVELRVVHGVSFLDLVLASINFDFSMGLQILLPLAHLQRQRFRTDLPLLVCQIQAASLPSDRPRADLTMKWLLEAYPPDHPSTLLWTDRWPAHETHSKGIPLRDLAREYGEGKFYASLFVPPLGPAATPPGHRRGDPGRD